MWRVWRIRSCSVRHDRLSWPFRTRSDARSVFSQVVGGIASRDSAGVNTATEQQPTARFGHGAAPEMKRTVKLRLLLADDHPVVRLGMRSFFEGDDSVEIVGEAVDGRDALAKARELKPDVVFMDTYMPRMTGLAVTRLLGKQVPKARVLLYSSHSEREYVLQIIRSGARGYVLKNAQPEELRQAVEQVGRGQIYYNSDVAKLALDEFARNLQSDRPHAIGNLSEREMEVLGKIAEGKSSRETAEDFGISVRTVETHREHIMQKLKIRTVAGLVKFAIQHGVVPLAGSP